MRTWFGDIEDGSSVPAGNNVEALAKWAASADSRNTARDVDFEALAEKSSVSPSREAYRSLLHETAMHVAREAVRRGLEAKDTDVLQAVRALDDVNQAFNVVSERLTEWHGAHFPEQSLKPLELIDFILKHEAGEDTAIKGLAFAAKALYDERKSLEAFISSSMEELAPNLSRVLGPVLGARLMARAGGIDELAKMPAGTIQVMGAGDALFKHLRSGTPSPKHGLIYKHPLISGSPKSARGKISRMLAGKAAIAARVDFYSGETVDFGDLKEKAAEIKKRSGGRKKHG